MNAINGSPVKWCLLKETCNTEEASVSVSSSCHRNDCSEKAGFVFHSCYRGLHLEDVAYTEILDIVSGVVLKQK